MLRENVYDDCRVTFRLHRFRTSKIMALYQELPSLLFNSIVEKAGFCRGAPRWEERCSV